MRTKIDLITGFLGAGKTRFILDYAREMIRRGERVGIIENDYGAINVDLLLLHRELSDCCRMEMVIGGDPDCHRRRLKTKLIAMGIDRYDRVIVEPSGIFDVEEFTDILYEEPLDHLAEMNNVITVVDAAALTALPGDPEETGEAGQEQTNGLPGKDAHEQPGGLSRDERYILAEQLTRAGCILLSKTEGFTEAEWQDRQQKLLDYLNASLEGIGCSRRISEQDVIRKVELSDRDWERLMTAGHRDYSYIKQRVIESGSFSSLFFFYPKLPDLKEEAVRAQIESIFADPENRGLARLKGFLQDDRGEKQSASWLEINATRERTELRESPVGQPVLIAIGEGISEEAVGRYLQHYENEYRG